MLGSCKSRTRWPSELRWLRRQARPRRGPTLHPKYEKFEEQARVTKRAIGRFRFGCVDLLSGPIAHFYRDDIFGDIGSFAIARMSRSNSITRRAIGSCHRVARGGTTSGHYQSAVERPKSREASEMGNSLEIFFAEFITLLRSESADAPIHRGPWVLARSTPLEVGRACPRNHRIAGGGERFCNWNRRARASIDSAAE